MDGHYSFERGALDVDEIERLTAEIWADLAFDEAAKAALKRDGLLLNGLRLTGPNPFTLSTADGHGEVTVSVAEHANCAALIDLWRVHFLRRIRERTGHDGVRSGPDPG